MGDRPLGCRAPADLISFDRAIIAVEVAVDVWAWLREPGLERYEPAFREDEIDPEVLPDLTEGPAMSVAHLGRTPLVRESAV